MSLCPGRATPCAQRRSALVSPWSGKSARVAAQRERGYDPAPMADLLITRKRIDIHTSPVLYDRPFTPASLAEDWEFRNSTWECRDGALWGRNPQPTGGVLFTRESFPADVLLDFHARTVLPSTHDLDVMWNMSYDDAAGARAVSYVGGIQGWWEGKVGIERSPEYKLAAMAPCPWFRPGQDFHVQAGSIEGHCFLFVDGTLRVELMDPDPIDPRKHGKVGFETYQSMIRVSRLVVRKIAWEPRVMAYPTEFD